MYSMSVIKVFSCSSSMNLKSEIEAWSYNNRNITITNMTSTVNQYNSKNIYTTIIVYTENVSDMKL